MELTEVIERRRAYRSLKGFEVTEDLVRDLATAAQLAPSCFNNQPWRFIFVIGDDALGRILSTLTEGNKWARRASMVVAVVGRKEDDCVSRGREYYMFDIGMAAAFLMLRATDLGLVAHPIAGFNAEAAAVALGVPEGFTVITLLIVGRHAEGVNDLLSDSQKAIERKRPERRPLKEFAFIDRFSPQGSG